MAIECKELASETIRGDVAVARVLACRVGDDFYVCATLEWDGGNTEQERRCHDEADAIAHFALACRWARSELGK